VHGIVFEDIDGNGARDPFAGEMGLMGWSVSLFNSLGQVLASASTDDAGNFVFTALPNGSYSTCVSMQGGYTQTAPTSGTGCGGLGYAFTINGTFQTWVQNVNFGMMLP
jgi:serine-aspartate repeat-containing protein C/D/E